MVARRYAFQAKIYYLNPTDAIRFFQSLLITSSKQTWSNSRGETRKCPKQLEQRLQILHNIVIIPLVFFSVVSPVLTVPFTMHFRRTTALS